VPFEIKKLLYIDLSNEVVESKGDRIEFATKGYSKELTRLVKELRTAHKYELTKSDKAQIQKEIEKPKAQKRPELFRIYLKVAGFTSIGKKRWRKALRDIGKTRPIPVLFPQIFEGLMRGDKLKVILNNGETLMAHFAGYRKDNLKIVFPSILMRTLPLEIHKIYAFEFDKKNKALSILGE